MKKARPKAKVDPVALFRLLADSNRHAALLFLLRAKRGYTVSEVAAFLATSHSSASHLLGLLHETGIVTYRREGREMRYMIGKNATANKAVRLLRTA